MGIGSIFLVYVRNSLESPCNWVLIPLLLWKYLKRGIQDSKKKRMRSVFWDYLLSIEFYKNSIREFLFLGFLAIIHNTDRTCTCMGTSWLANSQKASNSWSICVVILLFCRDLSQKSGVLCIIDAFFLCQNFDFVSGSKEELEFLVEWSVVEGISILDSMKANEIKSMDEKILEPE